MFRVRTFDEIDSTNIEVKRAIDSGEPEGLVVRARCQTGGYGRQGRAWRSPAGGLYFSMLLRPGVMPERLSTVALAAGLAVRRALVRFVPATVAQNVQVKWPNDIVVAACGSTDAPDVPAASAATCSAKPRFLKLCGISSEARRGAVCIGVGVNVLRPTEDSVSDEGEQKAGNPVEPSTALRKNAPAYLAELAAGYPFGADPAAEVLDAVLDEFGPVYRLWLDRGFEALAAEYGAHEALRGSRVDVVDLSGGVIASGIVAGVSPEGLLLVQGSDGAIVPVASGEAHIL